MSAARQARQIAGGVYFWQFREAADRPYDGAWRAFVTGRYGAPPQVGYMNSPVIVDNTTHPILAE